MAHEKLSPRQKMIGMMYLVLTAMLALNVSKEAVEAFKKVDKGLTQSIANYAIKNDAIYKEFDRAAAENPAKAGKYKTQAEAVRQRANEAFDYLQELKIEIINTAEGEGNLAVEGNQVHIDEVKKIDDNNVPSEILIGANEDGKANRLKELIAEYREFLISTLEGKNPTIEAALKSTLSTDNAKNEDGEIERWENLTFQALPLVAVICILSEYQLSVRNAETEVLNHLYSQIDASSFKFNKLQPIVIPNSSYVTTGSSYEARVFISAIDTTQTPQITVDGRTLELNESGQGIYKVSASSTGTKKWGGVIALRAPDGTIKEYPFSDEYTVGERSVIVSPTAMNVMYSGIANPIDVSVPGVSPNNINIRVTNGDYSREKVKNSSGENFPGMYAVTPKPGVQSVEIMVTANMNGTPQNFPYKFRVKPLPDPIAMFGGKNSGKIAKASAVAQQGVFAEMPGFDFPLQYKITGFTVLVSERGNDYQETSTSSTLTAAQKNLINRLQRGRLLIIKDINALGPDGRTRELGVIGLTID